MLLALYFSRSKTGKDDLEIWLSIMGEVYDVTMGKDFYGPGASYNAFSGRDASVPYVTGKFTAEEAEKGPDVIPITDMPGLLDWRGFYKGHYTYTFVGYLVDPRFYDDEGKPTTAMVEFQERLKTLEAAKAEAAKAKAAKAKAAKAKAAKAKAAKAATAE
jgi:hypothetical protein